jgi:protein phosphatase
MVADGMGGHAAGEIASDICTKTVAGYLKNAHQSSNWQEVLKTAVLTANNIIWQAAHDRPEYLGMGTTLTAIYIDGNNVFWAHVGDSRLYFIEGSKMRQVTEDHSVVWELMKNGAITSAEAKVHSKRNMLTRAVGTEKELKVDTGIINWQKGDRLLLCSDGLTNMISEDEILKAISSDKEPQNAELIVNELIEKANAEGGADNITAILIMNYEL